MAEATSATEKAIAEGDTNAPSPGQQGAETQPTPAQVEQGAEVSGAPVPSPEQTEQYQKDQQARIDAGYLEPIGRDANPEFGGESFAYGPAVNEAERAEAAESE